MFLSGFGSFMNAFKIHSGFLIFSLVPDMYISDFCLRFLDTDSFTFSWWQKLFQHPVIPVIVNINFR